MGDNSVTFYGSVYRAVESMVRDLNFRDVDPDEILPLINEALDRWLEEGTSEEPSFREIQDRFPEEWDAACTFIPELYALEGLVEKTVRGFLETPVIHLTPFPSSE